MAAAAIAQTVCAPGSSEQPSCKLPGFSRHMRARISLKEAGIDPEMKFSCSVLQPRRPKATHAIRLNKNTPLKVTLHRHMQIWCPFDAHKSSSPLSFASCSGTVPLNLFAPRRLQDHSAADRLKNTNVCPGGRNKVPNESTTWPCKEKGSKQLCKTRRECVTKEERNGVGA
eukprot:6182878-Pleurochrysis_carterae.AAC.1